MKKVLDKWYISMIVLPTVLTYLTNYFALPDIIANWKNSIISTLLIVIIILCYELRLCFNEIKELKFKPKSSDKEIINQLFGSLDLKLFQTEIATQDSGNGYKKEAIHKMLDFLDKSELIENRISDSEVRKLLNDFVIKLEDFNMYAMGHLFGTHPDYLQPSRDFKTLEEFKFETVQMDSKARESFIALDKLIIHLKERDYL